jgi:hypothetical protein
MTQIRVSVHNVTTHAVAEASGADWNAATRNALKKLGDRDGIATCEVVGTGCHRIQTGHFIRRVNSTSLGYVYTVSRLD